MGSMWKAVLVLALAACTTDPSSESSETPESPGSPELESTARQFFNEQVYSMLAASCGSAGCHSEASGYNGFVSVDPTRAYDVITASSVVGDYSDAAPIARPEVHNTPWSAGNASTILAWLALEREERY